MQQVTIEVNRPSPLINNWPGKINCGWSYANKMLLIREVILKAQVNATWRWNKTGVQKVQHLARYIYFEGEDTQTSKSSSRINIPVFGKIYSTLPTKFIIDSIM